MMLKINFIKTNQKKLTKRDIARFCGQLKMLLSSGVPLLEALRIVKNILQRKEYETLIQKVSEGESLASSMEGLFVPMVTSSVAGAEMAGNLEEVLARLERYYEDRAEVEGKMKSALVYPSFVVILCLVCMIVMFAFVLPGFKGLFSDVDAELPLLTQVIMSGGDIFARIWYIPLFVALSLSIVLPGARKTRKGGLILDSTFLRLKWFSREQIIQSFRTLGSLLQGGIPILAALETTGNSLNNKAYQKNIMDAKANVENGERLSEVFARNKIFPKEMIQMVSVGENSGKLAEMLLSIADFYEKEKEVFIKRFTTLLEPALTLFVGIMVGVIAIAMFMPMVNMISQLQ